MRGSWLAMTILTGCGSLHCGCVYAQSPQPLGSVAAADAEVTTGAPGVVPVAGGVAKLAGASTITANPGRNAQVSLARGGDVLVCQTSVLHATPAGDALVLALDRGAMEIHRKTLSTDVVMTPDMRISPAEAGPLDLRLRVTFNGDTCIENRGRKAPPLNVTDAFGETTYQLKPGQHVMFEHGSLREVVDRETTPCGCPPAEKPGVSIADALLNGGRSDSGAGKITPEQAAAAHPFPRCRQRRAGAADSDSRGDSRCRNACADRDHADVRSECRNAGGSGAGADYRARRGSACSAHWGDGKDGPVPCHRALLQTHLCALECAVLLGYNRRVAGAASGSARRQIKPELCQEDFSICRFLPRRCGPG